MKVDVSNSKSLALGLLFIWNPVYGAGADEDNTIFYNIWYADEECSQFAGMNGHVSGTVVERRRAVEDVDGNEISCIDGMACMLNANSSACEALNPPEEYIDVVSEVREDGVIFSCDPSNFHTNEDECVKVAPTICRPSTLYNCYLRQVSEEELTRDPAYYVPALSDDEEYNAALDDYTYSVFYSGGGCKYLEGIRGDTVDSPLTLPAEESDQGLPCDELMKCYFHPTSEDCAELGLTGEYAPFLEVKDDGTLYECDSTNDVTGEEECNEIDPTTCYNSSVFFACNFKFFTGSRFVMDFVDNISPQVIKEDDESTVPEGVNCETAITELNSNVFLAAATSDYANNITEACLDLGDKSDACTVDIGVTGATIDLDASTLPQYDQLQLACKIAGGQFCTMSGKGKGDISLMFGLLTYDIEMTLDGIAMCIPMECDPDEMEKQGDFEHLYYFLYEILQVKAEEVGVKGKIQCST